MPDTEDIVENIMGKRKRYEEDDEEDE